MPKLKITAENTRMGIISTVYNETNTPIAWWFQAPTGNCQLASIACFQSLLGHTDSINMIKTVLWNHGSFKKMLFIDVLRTWDDAIEKLFSKVECPILGKTPYTNTRGTEMTHWIITVLPMMENSNIGMVALIDDKPKPVVPPTPVQAPVEPAPASAQVGIQFNTTANMLQQQAARRQRQLEEQDEFLSRIAGIPSRRSTKNGPYIR